VILVTIFIYHKYFLLTGSVFCKSCQPKYCSNQGSLMFIPIIMLSFSSEEVLYDNINNNNNNMIMDDDVQDIRRCLAIYYYFSLTAQTANRFGTAFRLSPFRYDLLLDSTVNKIMIKREWERERISEKRKII
jgi:hypothetical protein